MGYLLNDIANVGTITNGNTTSVQYQPPFQTSPLTTTSVASTDTQSAVRGVAPNGTTRALTQLRTALVQPVSGQANNTPAKIPDPSAYAVDSYRNGDPTDTTGDMFFPRVLSTEDDPPGGGANTASISLTVPPPPDTTGMNTGQGFSQPIVNAYSRFFLQSVNEVEQEKYQIVETFKSFYAFFYGKRPPIYRYTGLLLADPIYSWNNDFKFMYENYFRGTSATSFNAEVFIFYPGRIITGFPLSLSMQQEAMTDKGVPFAIDVLVVNHQIVNFSEDIAGLLQQSADNIDGIRKSILAQQAALQTGSGKSVILSDSATNGIIPLSSVGTQSDYNTLKAVGQLPTA